MRILIFSPWFPPSFGGVETVVQLLAAGLSLEHVVTVATTFPSNEPEAERPYTVLRRARLGELLRAVRAADVVLMFSASLRFIGLPLLLRKPLAVNHYTWPTWDTRPLITALQWIARLGAIDVAPSEAVACTYGRRTRVLPNPFDDHVFREHAKGPRDRDLVFLGRLVEEKGVDLLLDALIFLRNSGRTPSLTLIGDGPAAPGLKARSEALGIAAQIHFAGVKSGSELAGELGRHRVMVVPSRWREPFGIVALEGLASGCRLVIADDGGLPEAAGPTGILFARGDASSLAKAIAKALNADDTFCDSAAIERHLDRYSIHKVACAYTDFFRQMLHT